MTRRTLTKLASSILGDIPHDWDTSTIGAVASLGSGGTPSRSKQDRYFTNGTTPWVKTGDLNNAVVRDTEEHITELALSESNCSVYPAKTLLIAMYGGFKQIGRTGLLAKPAATNQALTAIQVRDGSVNVEFLQHWLNAKVNAWRPLAGSSRKDPNITKSEIAIFPVPLPPKLEQVAISRVLRTLRDQIDCIGALYKGRRKLKRGLLQQLLTGQRRFPEFRKQPWVDVPIGDLLREEERYVKWSDDEEYRLVSVRRRSGGFFDRERKRGRDILTKTLKVTLSGDFVLARMQVLHGAMTVTPRDFDGAHVSDSYMTFVSKDDTRLHMPYFGYLSSTRLMYHKALISSVGVAIEKMSFNPRWWLAERVRIPSSLEEQQRIANVLQACDRELELLRTLHDALKEQKKRLMQKLLTGQVRVPASMLKEAAHA